MTKKLLLIATMFVASSLSLDTNEAQAQGWRNYNRGNSNRGLNTHVYSYPANRGVVYSNRSYAIQMYTPSSAYSLGYSNYGVPSRYGYGNNFGNSFGYGFPGNYVFPSGNGYWGGYDYRSNFNNYGYGPSLGNTYSPGVSGYGTYRRYSF
jgi:hypothetical protein